MTQAETTLSEAEGASQVAAWESKSLREELQVLRERSADLSSALEAARAREAAATATAQDGVSLSVLFCLSFLVVFFRFVCFVRIFVVSSIVGLPVPSVRLYTGGGWGGGDVCDKRHKVCVRLFRDCCGRSVGVRQPRLRSAISLVVVVVVVVVIVVGYRYRLSSVVVVGVRGSSVVCSKYRHVDRPAKPSISFELYCTALPHSFSAYVRTGS